MRKILQGCLFVLLIGNGQMSVCVADDTLKVVEAQTQRVKDKCYVKAFPKDKMDEILALNNDETKYAEQRYAVCMEQNIFDAISKHYPPEIVKKMKKSLMEFRKYYRQFYWDLYNTEDNGTIGRMQNDAAYSRRLDDILYDINLRLHTY